MKSNLWEEKKRSARRSYLPSNKRLSKPISVDWWCWRWLGICTKSGDFRNLPRAEADVRRSKTKIKWAVREDRKKPAGGKNQKDQTAAERWTGFQAGNSMLDSQLARRCNFHLKEIPACLPRFLLRFLHVGSRGQWHIQPRISDGRDPQGSKINCAAPSLLLARNEVCISSNVWRSQVSSAWQFRAKDGKPSPAPSFFHLTLLSPLCMFLYQFK